LEALVRSTPFFDKLGRIALFTLPKTRKKNFFIIKNTKTLVLYLRNMGMDVLKIVAGLVGLIVGGEWLLRAAVGTSNRFVIPKFIIGMTVVSFATSLPELIVSVRSALAGYPDLALGNVVGSNIANLGLVLGVVLLFTRIQVSKSFYQSDWPMMFIASILLWVFIQNGTITAFEGIALVVLLVLMLLYLLQRTDKADFVVNDLDTLLSWPKILLFILFGSAFLAFGSDLLVNGAVNVASQLGVSERVIAITVVSVGTSVPELAASLVAVAKRENAISIGNLLGSNLFNILAVLGITALIHPLTVVDNTLLDFDIYVMIGIAALLIPLVFLPKKMEIYWRDGLLLLTLYVLFIVKTLA
jgi:cation:H+ antiporter